MNIHSFSTLYVQKFKEITVVKYLVKQEINTKSGVVLVCV